MARCKTDMLSGLIRKSPPACAEAFCLRQGFGRQAAGRLESWKLFLPLPLRGEGGGEGESKPLPPHLNPLPRKGEEVY